MAEGASSKLLIYGTSWCPDCARAKQFLGEHNVDYDWVDVEQDAEAATKVSDINKGSVVTPTIVFPDGSTLSEPSNAELAKKLGLTDKPETDYHELIIIGAGPAGLSAAIYTTREDIQTQILESKVVGGLAGVTDTIDNYPGFAEGVSGLDLSEQMEKQARRFGADIRTGIEVKQLSTEGRYKKVATNQGDLMAKAVIISTGSDYRKLGIPGEKELTGRGVHYCATCDGPLYRGKRLVVVGGGNSAMQESIFLTKFADSITLLVRGPELKGSEILIDKLKTMDKISVHYNIVATAIKSKDSKVSDVEAVNRQTGKAVEFDADGVFVFIGLLPNTGWLKDSPVQLDEHGFIRTNKTLETSMPGVFAAGDVRAGSTFQIASAVGEGATAALMIREYLKEIG